LVSNLITKNFSLCICIYEKDTLTNIKLVFRGIFRNTILPNEILILENGPLNFDLSNYLKNTNYPKIFKIIKLQFNIGLARGFNLLARQCINEWIIKQDADDFSYKTRFAKLMKKAEEGYTLCGSFMQERYDNNSKFKRSVPINFLEIKNKIKYRNPFNNPTMLINKKIFNKLLGFPSINYKEDYALWIIWLNYNNKIMNLSETLVSSINSKKLIQRRKETNSIKNELQIRKMLYTNQHVGYLLSWIIFFLRMFIFIAPLKLMNFFYLRILRSNAK
jgi:hypothetical protein